MISTGVESQASKLLWKRLKKRIRIVTGWPLSIV